VAKGIVVEHKESGVRYAISEKNFNGKLQKKVRDLHPGETIIGYAPRRAGSLAPAGDTGAAPGGENSPAGDSATASDKAAPATKTEGSSDEGTKDAKKKG
jgi:hypothetical protein